MSPRVATVAWALALFACTQPRFELRAPVTRADDRRPLAHAPRPRESLRAVNAMDELVLGPMTRALEVEPHREAVDVNALDEVPASTWFTPRTPTPEQSAAGACAGVPSAVTPLRVERLKDEGTTSGLIARDALGRMFVLKLDAFPEDRPELSTAADAIVSRIYWSIGFNTPCNEVRWFSPGDVQLGPGATASDAMGDRRRFAASELQNILAHGVHDREGRVRMSTSLFLAGELLGPWPATGVRGDDPNDTIPHEDRRELRGEQLLATWVNHWDTREINTLDAFGGNADEPFVTHYFLDFSDALGGRTSQRDRAARLGYAGVLNVHVGRATWQQLRPDDRAPSLGYFEWEHFDPSRWQPLVRATRFANADPQDLGWMARRIVTIDPSHLRAIVDSGDLEPPVRDRLLEVLEHRRERLLRWAFSRSSPLADATLDADGRLCVTDLAAVARIDALGRLDARWLDGDALTAGPELSTATEGPSRVCVTLPPTAATYGAVDLTRHGDLGQTRIRIHVARAAAGARFSLVGIER